MMKSTLLLSKAKVGRDNQSISKGLDKSTVQLKETIIYSLNVYIMAIWTFNSEKIPIITVKYYLWVKNIQYLLLCLIHYYHPYKQSSQLVNVTQEANTSGTLSTNS